MRLISVAVPVPFLDALTYNVPEHLRPPEVGARVLVPLGSRTVTGCVTEVHGLSAAPQRESSGNSQDDVVKDIIEVVDEEAIVRPSMIELCRWVSDYYMCGLCDALGAVLRR